MFKKLLFSLALIVASTEMFSQTAPFSTWTTEPPTSITLGSTYTVAADYDAGDDGMGVDYTVDAKVQFVILEYNSLDVSQGWRAGNSDNSAGGMHSGNATVDWTIPSLTPSADLDSGNYYVMGISWKNSNDTWSSSTKTPITIVAAPEPDDVINWSPVNPTISSDSSIDIEIEYTSDEEIPVGGIKFTLWTITTPFSDVWHGQYSNSTALPAGDNLTTTIPVSVPAGLSDGNGNFTTTADLTSLDPNTEDPTYPGESLESYSYQLRLIAVEGDSFEPAIPDYSLPTITAALSTENIALHKNTLVYPNPTEGRIKISDLKGAQTITVTNLLGKTLKEFSATNSIDISDVVPGVYIIQTDNGLRRKIVKQ